jgi:RND family efflux transporter MFP subunit
LQAQARARVEHVEKGPRVHVAEVRAERGERTLTLPADVRGFEQTTVYAKTAGYVKTIAVDKGDTVQKGQVLAVLESPELDQQVAAAEADYVVKQRTYQRYERLVQKDFVSQQDFDATKAAFFVAQAQREQLRALQRYETLRAPFAGTVTARYVDPGALVPAANGSTQGALPLVDVADLRRVRVLVFVHQDAALFVRAGDAATINVDERPELVIDARISRISGALDPRSRTMLCEIWLDNIERLFPGTFVHVTLRLPAPALPTVTASAVVMRGDQPALALIRDSRVRFVPVRLGLDDGKTVQILEGVRAGDRVAVNVPAEIAEGALVQPIEEKTAERGPR